MLINDVHLIEELCNLPGISGREDAVRNWIIAHLPGETSYEIDPLGNLIVQKQQNSVPVFAHMDEVGLIVTHITEDGLLQFAHVGGIDPAAYFGKPVRVGEEQLPGVVGVTPVHLLEDSDMNKIPKQDQLYIDIGAHSQHEAQQRVAPGDAVTFAPGLTQFGDGFIRAKALDDRIGCLLLLQLLHNHSNLCGVFTVREEVGGAASAAAFALSPRAALVLETTTAADLPGAAGAERVCALRAGAVVPFMDSGTVYPRELYELAMFIAKSHDISVQTKSIIAGSNDARGIHTVRGGVPTLTISVPCRNLHSPSVVLHQSDVAAAYQLAELLWKELSTR